ncbi:hypothetical protein PQZ37_00745 [bacterium]|jgi:hypothetical protein|nr:hypothetical protein [bacterium]
MKFFAILPATLFAASPVLASPYVNVENNAGFSGSNFIGHVTDFHLGYEGGNGYSSYYVQAGPSIFAPDGGEEETKLTGKLGGSVQATERLSVYGEVAATFDDVNDYGTKVGVKYSF